MEKAELTLGELLGEFPSLFEAHNALTDGELQFFCQKASDVAHASPHDLLFIPDLATLRAIPEKARPCAAIVSSTISVEDLKIAKGLGIHFLRSKYVPISMAKIKSAHFAVSPSAGGQNKAGSGYIHSTAVVHPDAKISPSARVEAYAVIEKDCTIGERTWVGPHAHLQWGTTVGSDTHIWSHVFIGYQTSIGSRCQIRPHAVIGSEGYGFTFSKEHGHLRIPQTGCVIIEDDVEIGTFNSVDRATFHETRIGKGTKFDAHVHIAHNCQIGKHVLAAGDAMVAGSSTLGDYCVLGGSARVTDHVHVPAQTQIGGLGVVSKSVEKPGAYGGYPLQPVKDYLRTTATLLSLTRMRKEVDRILQHLGLESDRGKE